MTLTFKQVASNPIKRLESGVAVARGRLHVMGGHLQPRLQVTREMHAYDPAADRWRRCADMPSAVTHITAAVQADRFIWIAGGYEGDHPGMGVANVWRYDVDEDRWADAVALPQKRASGALLNLNGHLHYFGGLGADRVTNFADHWAMSLDTTDRWEPRAPMPDARGHFSAVAMNGKAYAMGGHFFHDEPGGEGEVAGVADLDLVHVYDATTDRWSDAADMPQRRSHAEPATCIHNGRIVIMGGRNNSPHALPERKRRNPMYIPLRGARKLARCLRRRPYDPRVSDISVFDPATNAWKHLADLPRTLYAPAAGVIGDTLVVTNGGTNKWADPTDQTWIATLAR